MVELSFGVLGPLEVKRGDTIIPIPQNKHRIVLATLLLRVGRIVPVEDLTYYLWGTDPPETARKTLQGYVAKIRKLLGNDVIASHPIGYSVATDNLDLLDFDRLLDAAKVERDPRQRVRLLRDALALFRSTPLVDIPSEYLHQREGAALVERWLNAIELRFEAELEAGHHVEVIPQLRDLVATHPFREAFWRDLMIALYRSGRQADALETYQRLRKLLVDELGVEPSPRLRDLHMQILTEDPALGRRDDEPEQKDDRPVLPAESRPAAQLPPAIVDFVGREEEIRSLTPFLRAASTGSQIGVPIVAVSGLGGVGKTTLALRIAHEIRDSFPDGQLFVNLRGTVAPRDPADVLRELLLTLGVEGFAIPDGIDQRAALYRGRLAGRRVLVVLDDAASEAQIRPLLPGSANCGVIVTSRQAVACLEGTRHLRLGMLSPKQAVDFITAMARPERVAAEPEAAAEIVRLCGRLPLALRIAGARLVARPDWPLSVFVARLADESRRLTELSTRDLTMRSSIELSYRSLSPTEQRAFRLLSNLNAEMFPSRVAAAALGTSLAEAEGILEHLVDSQMLDTRVGPDKVVRYTYHDLMRLYGQEQFDRAGRHDGEAALRQALTGWYALASAANQRLALLPVSIPPVVTLPAGQEEVSPAELGPNQLLWLETESPALLSAMSQAASLGCHELCIGFGILIAPFYDWRGHFELWRRVVATMWDSARATGDPVHRGAVLLSEGNLRESEGRYSEARACFASALEIFRRVEHPVGIARAMGSLALQVNISGDPAGARALAEGALRLARDIHDPYGEAVALHHLALVHRELGEPATGASYARQAGDRYQSLGCLFGQTLALCAESWCELDRGGLAEARAKSELWLHSCRANGDRRGEAYALQNLAEIALRAGDLAAARSVLSTAWQLTMQIGWQLGYPHVLLTMGRLHRLSGEDAPAEECLRKAARLFDEAGEHRWYARAQAELDRLAGRAEG